MLNVGSCGLHTLHNAFKAGLVASGFDIGSLLSSVHWLFKDSPARRDDFQTITGCDTFPLAYCGHRWLENVSCMERCLLLLPYLREYVLKVKIQSGSEPSCKSFSTLKDLLSDKILEAKIEACLSIARAVTPFLQKYQTDAPMLPFFATDLFILTKRLLSRIVKPDILETLSTPLALCKVSVLACIIF